MLPGSRPTATHKPSVSRGLESQRGSVVASRALRFAAVGAAILVVTAIVASPGLRPSVATAAGGPNLALGTPYDAGGGVQRVPIEAVTTATTPYQGFNLHVGFVASSGVTVSSVTGSVGQSPTIPNSLLLVDSDGDTVPDSGSAFCQTTHPSGYELTFSCTTLAISQPFPATATPPYSTSATGLLATVSVAASGNGCVQLLLMDLPDGATNSQTLDSYTLFLSGGQATSQSNSVSHTPVSILIGSGTSGDCNSDDDHDGCIGWKELRLNPWIDPTNPWDFYSVPVPPLFLSSTPTADFRDDLVATSDAQAVFAYFKKSAKVGTLEYDQDLDLNGVPDGQQYDRTVLGPGRAGAPNGIISSADAQLAFAQFKLGYNCRI